MKAGFHPSWLLALFASLLSYAAPAHELDSAPAAYKRADYVECLEATRKILKYNPFDLDANYYKALSCQHLGYIKEAAEAYRKILEYSPNSAQGKIAAENLGQLSKITYGKRSPLRLYFSQGARGPMLECQLNGRPCKLRFDPNSEGVRIGADELNSIGIHLKRIDAIAGLEKQKFSLIAVKIKVGPIQEETMVTALEEGNDPTIGADFFALPYKINEQAGYIEFK